MNSREMRLMQPQGPVEVPVTITFAPMARYQVRGRLLTVKTVEGEDQTTRISDWAILHWQLSGWKGVMTWRRYTGFTVELPLNVLFPSTYPRVETLLKLVEVALNPPGHSAPPQYPLGARGVREIFYDQAGDLLVSLRS